MVDLITTRASLITCVATPEALEELEDALRVAPDEALLVAAPKAADKVVSSTAKLLRKRDPHALVVDASDAWQGLTISGQGALEIFAHVSQLELPQPEGSIQGDVGRMPSKVIVRAPGDRITMFVPATQAHSLRERILALGAVLRPDPEPWSNP